MRKLFAILCVLGLLAGMAYLFLFKNGNVNFFDQGVEYYNQKKYNEALFYFEKAEQLDNVDALKYSGTIYLETNDPQKAVSKFEKYISKIGLNNKDSKFALNDLGVAYFKLNDIENAKKYWKKAVELGNETSLSNLKELETKLK
ncbi:tetratricopeptide repeat protein [Chryseobacterium shigense]|uniref:Tetratricopeptide (TPR) repeat protein n=1 Tax=Chryseobacterium shigense TaxID=297244 RepID=A0A841N2X5_9FLAO|nr:tetratricopeptide repeat protein [Chryseobacterium shigense]MBB6369081.1 tetratricopeptide (TPR) repeat protein [Chryseobacterium shigense]